MAFPSVQGTPATNAGTGTTVTVNLPGSISAGELLIAFVALTHTSAATLTPPGDWNTVYNSIGNGNNRRSACFWRKADGAEGASFSVTASAATAWATVAYRVNNWGGIPEGGTLATGNSTNPDPPNLAPSWGARDTLWFAHMGRNNNSGTPTAPTDYTNIQRGGTTNASSTVAERQLNAASENPGTFTANTSNWGANTVAIRPPSLPVFRQPTRFFIRSF
jgi:hypothetical protein